jgi:hypothetical protein
MNRSYAVPDLEDSSASGRAKEYKSTMLPQAKYVAIGIETLIYIRIT